MTICWARSLVAFLGSPIGALVVMVGLKTVASTSRPTSPSVGGPAVRARAEGVELSRTPGRTVWS